MNVYQKRKERARQMAIKWQASFDEHAYSWAELARFEEIFSRLGRRYGLLMEFRENGII